MATPAFPQPFGKYLLVRKLALGGMAEIFLAKSRGAEGFQRDVVIKRILPSYSEDEAFVTMFIDEARIAARLHHPNIVQIFDFDKCDESFYIAMEYVDGRDLRKVLDRSLKTGNRLTPLRAVHIVADIAAGLKHAHGAKGDDGIPLNVVHRDVSPHNILVAFGGEAKILDFGIAKAAARSTKTRAGTVKGKCSYMSPEQARGKPLDGRSDMFALCAIAWEMLAGRKLFDGETDFEILNHVLNQEVVAPSNLNPDVPEELDAILLRGLARDREERYPDMASLEKELRNFEFRNARGLDEVAVAPYLQELFAEELPATTPLPAALGAVPTVPPDSGTVMLPEDPVPETAKLPSAKAAPVGEGTPRGATPAKPPKTLPVGTLQGELESYLATSGAAPASGTSSSGTAATPSAPTPSAPTPVRAPVEGTPARGSTAQAGTGTGRKNVTLPLPQDEVETVLAKASAARAAMAAAPAAREPREPHEATPARGGTPYPAGTPVRTPVADGTPSALKAAGGGTGGKKFAWIALGLVGLAAIGFIIAMAVGRGGDEAPAAARTSEPAKVAPAAPEPAEPPPAVATPVPAAPTPAPTPAVAPVPAPGPRTAVLALTVDPAGAKVMIDGNAVDTPGGRGTVEGPFKVGDTIEVTATFAGRKPWKQDVVMDSAIQPLAIRLAREEARAPADAPGPAAAPAAVGTGFVTINARPWADVYYRGRKVGTTPLRSYEVGVGRQTFTLKNSVASRELVVTVEKGVTTSHVVDVK